MALFQLVYTSQAAEDISYSDILHILQEARSANSLQDISGILIFREGSFLQLIEGEENQVRDLAQRIFADPRHQRCKILLETQAVERVFPQFSMAYFDGDLSAKGIFEVESILEMGRLGSKAQDKILQCFKIFRDSEPQLKI